MTSGLAGGLSANSTSSQPTASPSGRGGSPLGCAARSPARTSDVVTTSSWSPCRIVVCCSGTKPSPLRTMRVTLAPLGRRSSKMATPWRRDWWPIVTWRTSAPISTSEVLSRSTSTEWTCSVRPRRPGHPGKRRRLDDGEDDDEHEDEVEDPLGVRGARRQWHGGEHDRHGAAQARPRQEGHVPPRHAEPDGRCQDRQGPRDEQQDEAR